MAVVEHELTLGQTAPRAKRIWRRDRLPQTVACTLITILVAFVVLYPLGVLVFGSIWTTQPGQPGSLTLDNFKEAFTTRRNYTTFWNTAWVMGVQTLLATILATILAWIVTRTDTPFRRTLGVLIAVPFFIPGILEALGWILLLSPNTGTINVFADDMLGFHPGLNIFSLGGFIWVMTLGSTSLIFLLLVAALQNMDSSLEESARTSGAGVLRTMVTVTLPLISPVIFGAALLTFIRSMESFEVPVLIGLPARILVFSNRIYAAVTYDFPPNDGLAAALGVSFIVLMMALIMVQNKVLRGKEFFVVTGKGYRPQIVRLGRLRWVTFGFCALFFLVATVLPLSQVLLGSFLRVFGLPRRDLFTLDNYTTILSDPVIWRSLTNTFVVCGVAAALTVALCTAAGYIVTRTDYRARRFLNNMTWLPWAVPGIVGGVAMLWAYTALPFSLYGSLALLVIVLATTGMPLAARLMSGVLVQLGPEMEESSRVHGAGWTYTFARVVLPLIKPALAGALLLLFVTFSRTVSTTILFTGPGTEMFAVTLFRALQNGELEVVSALGAVLMLINVLGLLIARRLGAFGDTVR